MKGESESKHWILTMKSYFIPKSETLWYEYFLKLDFSPKTNKRKNHEINTSNIFQKIATYVSLECS